MEKSGISRREISLKQLCDDQLQLFIAIHIFPRIVARPLLHYLVGLEPEQEKVLFPDLFTDLDICPVKRTDGQRTVEREFRVAGA